MKKLLTIILLFVISHSLSSSMKNDKPVYSTPEKPKSHTLCNVGMSVDEAIKNPDKNINKCKEWINNLGDKNKACPKDYHFDAGCFTCCRLGAYNYDNAGECANYTLNKEGGMIDPNGKYYD